MHSPLVYLFNFSNFRDELTVMNASNQSLVAWLSTRNSFLIGYSPNFIIVLKSNEVILYNIKLQVDFKQHSVNLTSNFFFFN